MNNFKIIYDSSENTLPNLEDKFDLIFIDGWHTFDQVMLDIYYSIKLVKKDAFIVIDDADSKSVGKAISYYEKLPSVINENFFNRDHKNLSFKRKLANITKYILKENIAKMVLPKIIFDNFYYQLNQTIVILKKIDDDFREWNYHKIF